MEQAMVDKLHECQITPSRCQITPHFWWIGIFV